MFNKLLIMLLTQKPSSSIYLARKEEDLLLELYEKGEEINLFELGVWQVYRGIVQLSKISHDGKEIIVGWASSDSAFGNWLGNSLTYRAVALSEVYVRWYSIKDIEKSPLLARQLLAQFSDRLIKSEQLLAITAIRKVEERLWQLLLMLKQEIGQEVVKGTRLKVRFTHQHLANAISTTRVTITRVLGDLQTKKWLDIDCDRHIIILDQ